MDAAYLGQNDLKALEDCLEVARPSESFRYAKDHEPDEDMQTWILANTVAEAMRIMLPKDLDQHWILEVKRVRRHNT